MHQFFKKVADNHCSHSALVNHKPQMPTCADGCNHISAKSSSTNFYYWRFSLCSPSGTRMKVRSNTGFILKVNRGTKFFGSLFDLRKNSLLPVFDSFRILLVGSIKGLLTTETHLMQKATDTGFAKF